MPSQYTFQTTPSYKRYKWYYPMVCLPDRAAPREILQKTSHIAEFLNSPPNLLIGIGIGIGLFGTRIIQDVHTTSGENRVD